VLGQIVDALRQHSVALIEADTDGVFFAAPEQWSEHDERELVASIARTLPTGIRLEYEGRYAAMFSYEVKNYALLTYSGALIVRGGALQSSRSEPYGIRFLREALLLIMRGDIVGLRQAFLATVAALQSRRLPVGDIATRVRLSRSARQYLAQRASHPEPRYEALLAAGWDTWESGDRARFYRAAADRLVWLPDDTDEPHEEVTPDGGEPPPWDEASTSQQRLYDVDYYIQHLLDSYAGRLRKAFARNDWEQLFRLDGQTSLFDEPIENIRPRWIRPDGGDSSTV
jgi:DNA polymerase, archaea type